MPRSLKLGPSSRRTRPVPCASKSSTNFATTRKCAPVLGAQSTTQCGGACFSLEHGPLQLRPNSNGLPLRESHDRHANVWITHGPSLIPEASDLADTSCLHSAAPPSSATKQLLRLRFAKTVFHVTSTRCHSNVSCCTPVIFDGHAGGWCESAKAMISTSCRTLDAIKLDLAQRTSSSPHCDPASATVRRVRLAASRDDPRGGRMRLSGEFLVLLSRFPASPRVGHGSHSVISDHTFRAPFRSKRRTVPAAITQSSSMMEEARTQPRSTPSSICGPHGHGGNALHANLRPFALAIMNGFSGHLRRTEVLMLQATDLVPPQTSVDARLQHWGLLLCPSERDVPSKTLAFDESVMLDSPWMTWAASWINALRQQQQNKSIWPCDQLAHNNTFRSIAARANVAFHGVDPYSLHHCGAPHNALTGHRNLTKSTRTVASRLLSTTSQKGNSCPPSNRHARPRDGGIRAVICTTNIDPCAAKRRS